MSRGAVSLSNSKPQQKQFNRGRLLDNRILEKMRNRARARRSKSLTRSADRNHIGWGPLPHNNFKNVRSMRIELVTDGGCRAHGSPPVNHKNAGNIVGDDFDFKSVLEERTKYQAKKGHMYDEVEYVQRWDKEELKRLRGNEWHLKYYCGSFPLNSI